MHVLQYSVLGKGKWAIVAKKIPNQYESIKQRCFKLKKQRKTLCSQTYLHTYLVENICLSMMFDLYMVPGRANKSGLGNNN